MSGKRRWTYTRLAAAAAATMLAAAIGGCGGGGTSGSGSGHPMTPAADSPLAKAGEPVQALYKNTCLSCHGANLEGRVGPATNLQHVGGRLTQEQIARQITNGGGNMPGFGAKLKPDEVAALASWLAATK